jgi:signal transduction histidine kinase
MLRRYALAPLQGLVLFGLSLIGLAQLAVAVVGSFTSVTTHYRLARWLPNLCRRLVHRWLGLEIPRPYRPKPPLPAREPGGLYRFGDQLYKRKGLVRYRQQSEWLKRDPATHRDHLWALLTPLTGGLAAGLPGGLIILGFFPPVWATIPLVIGGFAIGPWMLDLYGRWTSSLLGPPGRTGRHPLWAWIVRRTQAVTQLGATLGLSLLGLPYAAVNLLSLYPGILAPLPFAVRVTRPLVNLRRDQIRRWSGVKVAEPYLPPPPPPVARPDGKYQAGKRLYDSPRQALRMQLLCATLKDKATWRDTAWLALDPFVTITLAVVPIVLGVTGFFVYFWSWVWAQPLALFTDANPRAGWAYLGDLIPGLESVPHWMSPVAGLFFTLFALVTSKWLLHVHGLWSRLLLAPTKSAALTLQVAHLTETRTNAIDTQAAELRRIERDLHDGAQARWVAMGLNLGAVEQLIDQDPDAAKKLLANARDASAEALVELRHLVRGIHPPVLAERGLGDAVRAMALDSALAVHVAVDLPGRVTAPIEAAMYFAISELLTNAAKHAHAKRVSVDIRHYNGRLRVTVADDGRGGADPAAGSGLQGVRKRLATFDGELILNSPPGGPTTATLEVPCALSSPKTSTSSETA